MKNLGPPVLLNGLTQIAKEDFPRGWSASQLKDFCSFIQGGRSGLTKEKDYRTSGVRAFSAAGQDGYVEYREFHNVAGIVLSAIGANCGRCFLAQGDWTTLANVQAIIPDENRADARYVYYRVNRDRYWPRSGSAQPFIKPSDIKKCWIALPELSEQSAIARVVEKLDATIQKTEAIIEKLKQVKQGLLHDLLTRGIDENGELRPPRSEAPHLYKESPLGWIPKEWTTPLLDEVSIRGSGHTPNKNIRGYWNGGVKWVSLADSDKLDKMLIDRTDKEISHLGIANSSAELHAAGTVILSRDAGIGKSAILGSPMAVSQHFIAWQCAASLNNKFLYFWLQQQKPRFDAIAIGSTIKTIGLPYFKKLRITLPNREEQDQLVDALMGAEARIVSNTTSLEKLKMERVGLMDDLLSGRVRVTPLLKQ